LKVINNKYTQILNHGYTNIFLHILISFILSFVFIAHTINVPYYKKIIVITIFIVGTLVFLKYFRELTLFDYILFILIIILSISRMNNKGPFWLKNYYLYLSTIGIIVGVLIINNKTPDWVFLLPFMTIFLMVVYYFVKTKSLVESSYFILLNRNVLAKYTLTYGMLYTTNKYIKNKSLDLLVPTLTLAITFFSNSRTGLLMAMSYVLVIVIHKIFNRYGNNYLDGGNKSKVLVRLIYVFGLVLIIVAVFTFLISKSRFEEVGFSGTGRLAIYKAFFNELSFRKFLFGFYPSPLNDQPNLHNSYFQLIADVGALSILFYFMCLVSLLYYFKSSKLLMMFMLINMIYALPEHHIFLRVADIVFLPLIMIAFKKIIAINMGKRKIHLE